MSVSQALQHSWVTGDDQHTDPLTMNDMLQMFNKQIFLIDVLLRDTPQLLGHRLCLDDAKPSEALQVKWADARKVLGMVALTCLISAAERSQEKELDSKVQLFDDDISRSEA